MKIKLSSVLVEDQAKAFEFHTSVLGFEKNEDISLGAFRRLTVVSPEDHKGIIRRRRPCRRRSLSREFQRRCL